MRSRHGSPKILILVAVAVLGLIASSCGSDPPQSAPLRSTPVTGTTDSVPSPSRPLPSVAGPFASGRDPLPGFDEVAVRVTAPDGKVRLFCVLVARTVAQQQRGLMTVTDPTLGGYDGMLFEFGADDSGGFWMRNTPMPLSIAYLDAAGAPVGIFDMEPCRDSPSCPSYPPEAPYRRALEVPQGDLASMGVAPGAHLEPAGACRPAPS